jgi:type IX secretion system PorP/SprF family membrane protein
LKKRYFIFLLGLFNIAFAQDIHFSQYNGSLLNLSPAFTGVFNGDFRGGMIYRSQWRAVPVSYSTFSMHGEARLQPKQMQRDNIGVGFLFNNDKAGDARYTMNQFFLKASYIRPLNTDSSLTLSAGFNLGICSAFFDYSKMTFDEQFDGSKYSSSLATGENYAYTRYNYADINLGAGLMYKINPKWHLTYGVGLHHLNRPTVSFQTNTESKLDMKWANYLQAVYMVNDKVDMIGEALYNIQGKYRELIPHVSSKYYFNRDRNEAVLGGLMLRAKDAVIIRGGYTYKTLQSGIAYDINTSQFLAATNRRGGFEIFVNYVFSKPKPVFIKRRPCPVFM